MSNSKVVLNNKKSLFFGFIFFFRYIDNKKIKKALKLAFFEFFIIIFLQ